MNWDNDKNLDNLLEENLAHFEDNPSPWVLDAVFKDVPAAPPKGFSLFHGSGLFSVIGLSFLVGTVAVAYFLGYFDTASAVKVTQPSVVETEVRNSTEKPEVSTTGNINTSKAHSDIASVNHEDNSGKQSSASDIQSEPKQKAIILSEVETRKPKTRKSSIKEQSRQTIASSNQIQNSTAITRLVTKSANPSTDQLINSKSTTSEQINPEKIITEDSKSSLISSKTDNNFKLEFPSFINLKKDCYLALADETGLNFIPQNRENSLSSIFQSTNRKKYSYYNPTGNLSLSMYFQADYLSGKATETVARQRNLAGLGAIWSKNGMLFESGLVYCKENHDQKFNLSYNEFLGSYQKLDSIVFQVQNGQLIATNVMNPDSVYDDKTKSSNLTTSSSYSYLSIPLLIGYERQKSRFAFSIKTGLLMGLQINKKEEFPDSPENARVASINRTSPVLMTSNLQWVLRAGLNWYLTDQYGILVEPGFQGYLSKPYKPAEGNAYKPVYFGIKAGIFRKF